MATVSPEKRMARPAVAIVRSSASDAGRVRISWRNRLTMNSE